MLMGTRCWLLACWLLWAGCAAENAAIQESTRSESASGSAVEFSAGRVVFLPTALRDWEGWSEEALDEAGRDLYFVEPGVANEVEPMMARRPPRPRGGPSGRPAPPLLNPRPTLQQREAMRRRSEDVIAVHLARTRYFEALQEAKARYPNHQGYQNHHLIPIYLGGPRNGVTYRLQSAYHQAITQEFRSRWSYGQDNPPAPEVRQQILLEVYFKYPIPQLIGITP